MSTLFPDNLAHVDMPPPQTKLRARARPDRVRFLALISALSSAGIIVLILGTLLIQSLPALGTVNLELFTTHWNPAAGQYGIIPMVFGSVFCMLIAMSLALPIGGFAAITISKIRNPRLKQTCRSGLEILAGIPSIVYGLIGVAYVSIWVADIFDLQSGRIILSAAVILSCLLYTSPSPRDRG